MSSGLPKRARSGGDEVESSAKPKAPVDAVLLSIHHEDADSGGLLLVTEDDVAGLREAHGAEAWRRVMDDDFPLIVWYGRERTTREGRAFFDCEILVACSCRVKGFIEVTNEGQNRTINEDDPAFPDTRREFVASDANENLYSLRYPTFRQGYNLSQGEFRIVKAITVYTWR